MKKIICSLFFVLFVFTDSVFAQSSGACSYHNGVDCSRSDFNDGSVVCNDGWRDSVVVYDDVKKCTVDKTCPVFDDSKTYEELSKVWTEQIASMRVTQTDSCKSTYDRRINYANQLETSCKNLEELNKTSAMRSGREYLVKDCSQQADKNFSESTYKSCIEAVDVYDGILQAKKQLSCLDYKGKIISIMENFCRKTNSKWNNFTRKCDNLNTDTSNNNSFAEILGKSLKSFNSTPKSVVTVTSNSSPKLTQTLKLGSRGEEVRWLQIKLNVSPTGYFGPATKQAVIKFQKENEVTQTGTVGPATREKLNK